MTNEEKLKDQENNTTDTGTVEEKVQAEKTFTQEQVNEFVQNRLAKVYANYGVNNSQELDALVDRARGYDDMQAKYDELANQNRELSTRLSFINNNINPDKEDDVLAYFKGKELDLNDENLKGLLDTHQEWVNKPDKETTTVQVLGNNIDNDKPKTSEVDEAAKLFGLERFI